MELDPTKPVILLDIDGVLNSSAWISRPRGKTLSTKDYFLGMIDPLLAKGVADLVLETNASVIVCSSWRITLSLEELREILGVFGIPLEGVTPLSPLRRTEEILHFAEENLMGRPWIVLDDSMEVAAAQENTVRPRDGITRQDLERARCLMQAQVAALKGGSHDHQA